MVRFLPVSFLAVDRRWPALVELVLKAFQVILETPLVLTDKRSSLTADQGIQTETTPSLV